MKDIKSTKHSLVVLHEFVLISRKPASAFKKIMQYSTVITKATAGLYYFALQCLCSVAVPGTELIVKYADKQFNYLCPMHA